MSCQYPEQLNNPTIESSLKQWREQGVLGRIEGSKCEECGALYFPTRFVCPKCHSLHISTYRFKGNGTLINFVTNGLSQVMPMGFREHLPRIMCVVKLDEGPVIIGELIEIPEGFNVQIGTQVKTVIRKIARSANTSWKYAYKFVLSKA